MSRFCDPSVEQLSTPTPITEPGANLTLQYNDPPDEREYPSHATPKAWCEAWKATLVIGYGETAVLTHKNQMFPHHILQHIQMFPHHILQHIQMFPHHFYIFNHNSGWMRSNLTSSQGILSIFCHGISLIQNHQLES